jgi:hypothetical protein
MDQKKPRRSPAYGEPSSAEEQKQCCGFMRRRNLTRVRVEEKERRAKGGQTLEQYRHRMTQQTNAILDDAAIILGTQGIEAKLLSEIARLPM